MLTLVGPVDRGIHTDYPLPYQGNHRSGSLFRGRFGRTTALLAHDNEPELAG